jgi:hypothetical protein
MQSLFLLVVVACGQAPETVLVHDASVVEEALAATRPEALVELVEHTAAYTSLDSGSLDAGCPMLSVSGVPDGDDEQTETWLGGCAVPGGESAEGVLRRFSGEDGAWIAAEDFILRRGGEVIFELRGSIELYEENDLLNVAVAGSLCGGPTWSCEDGPVTLDLAYSIYPLSNFPRTYDATVSGVVAAGGSAPIAIDGVWSVDEAACATEPASGTIALRRSERQALELDGQTSCDGCADWLVQGIDAGPYCGLAL